MYREVEGPGYVASKSWLLWTVDGVASQDQSLGRHWLGRVRPLLTAATWLFRALASWLITKRGSTFQYSIKSYNLVYFFDVRLVHSGH